MLRLDARLGEIWGFSLLIFVRGHFQEIGIAALLFRVKPRHVEKFRKCRFAYLCSCSGFYACSCIVVRNKAVVDSWADCFAIGVDDGKIFQILFRKFSPPHQLTLLCWNVVQFVWLEIGKIVRYLPHKHFSVASQTITTATVPLVDLGCKFGRGQIGPRHWRRWESRHT